MKLKLLFSMLLLSGISMAQTVKEANVYPTNLEENMYFTEFNSATNQIKGLYCLLLSDGDNSEFVTPAFEITLYLLPEGSTSEEDLIVVKKYNIKGIYHFGSMELKEKIIDLNEIEGLQPGNYRLGIWVNSDKAFEENGDDNAMLFKGTLNYKGVSTIKTKEVKKDDWNSEPVEETEEEEEGEN
jgi:hypothetical protein